MPDLAAVIREFDELTEKDGVILVLRDALDHADECAKIDSAQLKEWRERCERLQSVIGDSLEVLDGIRAVLNNERDAGRIMELVNGYLSRAKLALKTKPEGGAT